MYIQTINNIYHVYIRKLDKIIVCNVDNASQAIYWGLLEIFNNK